MDIDSVNLSYFSSRNKEFKMPLTRPQIKKVLRKTQITLEDMEAVASSPKLKGFDSIDLSGKGITDDIGVLLICSKHLSGLLNLNLCNNDLTNEFVKILLSQPLLPDLNIRSNRITSAVIPELINKYNEALNDLPHIEEIVTICGISICSSSCYGTPKWVKLVDRIQEENESYSLNLKEINAFIKTNTIASGVSEFEKIAVKYSMVLPNKTYDRCIDGDMAGSDSLLVNVAYVVEDFFYLEHNIEKDMVFEFQKEAFEELDRRARAYGDDGSDSGIVVYDPLNLSEEEEKERLSFIDEVEKQCKARANKLGLPGVEQQEMAEGICLEMVLIPAGVFKMGSPKKEKTRYHDETRHKVTLTKPYYMGKYPVTQEQWELIMGSNPSDTKGAKLPVTNVSWEDCQEFIQKFNAKTNGGYRLPTEAEWDCACRAGTITAFSFGDQITPKDANYVCSEIDKPVAVGSYKPNAFGLYDMHGNVFEWCEDWFTGYPAGAVTDPKGPATGERRVSRGGSFRSDGRSSSRFIFIPSDRDFDFGFRLVRTP